MATFIACQCLGRNAHTHVPEKARVRLDNGAEVELDALHYEMNKSRVVEVVEIVPARTEYC